MMLLYHRPFLWRGRWIYLSLSNHLFCLCFVLIALNQINIVFQIVSTLNTFTHKKQLDGSPAYRFTRYVHMRRIDSMAFMMIQWL